MLILTRWIGEKFVIGNDVVIEVKGIQDDNTVKFGVEAPDHVKIKRGKVQDRTDNRF